LRNTTRTGLAFAEFCKLSFKLPAGAGAVVAGVAGVLEAG
jgi:hypothetical protein